MDSKQLIGPFADFARERKIDRNTVVKILEEVFRAMIRKRFGRDDNFDIIINLDQGDLQIWHLREIVANDTEKIEDHQISLSEARKIEPDFSVGEDVSEEISLDTFGRRTIMTAKQTLLQQVSNLEREALHEKYTQLIGEMLFVEVYQITSREVILLDEERKELFLPKSEQIPQETFRKGEYIKAIVQQIDLQNSVSKVILSRTSPKLLERLFETEVPEIYDGVITIKKVVRDPGERAKVAVETSDDRIDPIGACVGMKGARIHSIVKELRGENIDIINYTENLDLYIIRALSPAKVDKIQNKGDRISVYVHQDQVSLAIGRGGSNIKLASRLIGKEIDIYRKSDSQEQNQDTTPEKPKDAVAAPQTIEHPPK